MWQTTGKTTAQAERSVERGGIHGTHKKRAEESFTTMGKPEVRIDVRRVNGLTAILDIQGEVTGFGENVLMDAYNQATSLGARTLALNFTNLQYMNSSGIGLLVTLLIRAQRQKQRLVAYGLSEHYEQIFDLTRLNEAIGIYADETGAIASAG